MSLSLLSSGIAQRFPSSSPNSGIRESRRLNVCCSHRRTGDGDARPVTKLVFVPLAAVLVAGASMPDSARADFQLPNIPIPESAIRNTEARRRKYEEFDEKVRKSEFVQELLRRTRENAAKNKQALLDKYCQRQSEWGVGDCALPFSTPEEKKKFFDTLKEKRTAPTTKESTEVSSGTDVGTDAQD